MEEESLYENKNWVYADQIKRIKGNEFLNWLKEKYDSKPEYDTRLMVGTDSQLCGKVFKFITVVCVYKQGHGGDYYYTIDYEDKKQYRGKQHLRIQREVQRSVEIADWILDSTSLVSEIHIDASPKEANEFTSQYSDALKGYAIGAGYVAKIKPESFVASSVSDRHLR